MRITTRQLRQIINEELNEMTSLRSGSGGIKQMPMFDEEQQALRHITALASLYNDLQSSPHTEQVMDMEDAFSQTIQRIKSQQMRQGDIYTLVGMTAAIKALGLRDAGPEGGRDESEDV